ncbi:hypothetical protein Tco_0968530 [Tanacetum coccineum]
MAEDGKIKIDKFDGHDFGFWKMQIEDYLYQKKLHEPLAEARPTGMKDEDWTLLDRQALGAIRLSLAKNVAYNVVNENTTYCLFKALSNMYEKPNHVNEFNSILSRLMLVDIIFDDEVQALLHPESTRTPCQVQKTKAGAESKTEGRSITENQCSKHVTSRDKEVNMAAGDYDDALVCCVENTIDDRIMDSGASFHATYCKEELERFKLRSGKVRLADDKTLDIAGVGDVVLKTSFGTSWTLKDVRYIPGLKRRRLISAGQLEEEGYHVGFGDQQWKVTKDSLVVAHGNKRGSLYMVEDWYEHVSFQRQRFRCTERRYGSFFHNVKEDKETTEVGATGVAVVSIKFCVENGIVMLKMVPETPLQFGVAERLSRTFRAESTGIRAEAPKMLWADSVSTTYLIYGIPYVPIGLRIPEEEWRGKDTSRTLEVAQMKCDTAFGIRRVTRLSEAEILHLRTQFMEPENDSIVAEHELSSEITQSPCGSSDTSERSENRGSFKDSERSDEEYSEDGASSKEGGFETPQSKANGLGKDFPNPFMAGSLPKTIKQSNDPPLSMQRYHLDVGEGHEKDAEGISSLSNEEIFEQLAHMGIDGLEKDLQQTKKTYSTVLTKLVLRVKKLEYKVKSGKERRKAKIVLSNDEEITEDSSKQGRKISQIDEDPTISLDEELARKMEEEERIRFNVEQEARALQEEEIEERLNMEAR